MATHSGDLPWVDVRGPAGDRHALAGLTVILHRRPAGKDSLHRGEVNRAEFDPPVYSQRILTGTSASSVKVFRSRR